MPPRIVVSPGPTGNPTQIPVPLGKKFPCAGGRIAEHWGVFDLLGILQQLGAIPA